MQSLFEEEAPILPALETLRKAKSEYANKDRVHEDCLQALCIMAQTNPFRHIIHEIGMLKFFIHYWSPD